MNIEEEIRDAVGSLVRRHLPPVAVRDAVVLDVDWDSRTCHVQLDDQTERWDVRLRAAIPDPAETSGFCCKPKVNSQVLVGIVEGQNDNCYVCMFTDIDAIEIIYGSTDILAVDLTTGKITMNGGGNDGLVNILPLVAKINQLESKLTNFAIYVGALPIPVAGSVSGPPVTAATLAFQIPSETVKSDLEDTNVTH